MLPGIKDVRAIIAGLICTPVSIVSVTFGTIVYYMIAVIGKNADAIQNVASEELTQQILIQY